MYSLGGISWLRNKMNVVSWCRQHIPKDPRSRRFVLATLIDNVGTGVNLALFPIYLITQVGLSAVDVGIGLTGAAILGLLSAVPLGRTIDVVGPRLVLLVGCGLQASVAVMFVFTRTFWMFLLGVAIGRIASQAVRLSRTLLTAQVGGAVRNQLRGQVIVAVNTGLGVGMCVGIAPLLVDTAASYAAGFVLNAVTYVVAGVLQSTAGSVPALQEAMGTSQGRSSPTRTALRDVRFCTVTAVNSVLYFHQSVLVLGIPLWIGVTGVVPRWMVPVVFGINLGLTILLQMAASNRVNSVKAAGRAWRLSGFVLAVACLGIALSMSTRGAVVAIVLVAAAAVLLSVAEVWTGAAEFELSLALAPEGAKGAYQGLFTLGTDAIGVVGPIAVTVLCISLGPTGWVILGCGFAAVGFIAIRITGWAETGRREPALAGEVA